MNLLSKLGSKISGVAQSIFGKKSQAIKTATTLGVGAALSVSPQLAEANISKQNIAQEFAATRANPIIYTVKSGDSLSKIAARHNLSLDFLVAINSDDIKNPNIIKVGQTIKIFAQSKYTIKSGDTFKEIADRFNLSESELLKLNPTITNKHYIVAGNTINIIKETIAANDDNYESVSNGSLKQGNNKISSPEKIETVREQKIVTLYTSSDQSVGNITGLSTQPTQNIQATNIQSSNDSIYSPTPTSNKVTEELKARYSAPITESQSEISDNEMSRIDEEIAEQFDRKDNVSRIVEEPNYSLENIASKDNKSTYTITGNYEVGYNPNTLIPDNIRMILIETSGMKQFAYRKNALDLFKPANKRDLEVLSIFHGSKIKLYTQSDLEDKAYLADMGTKKTYDTMSIEERFEAYFETISTAPTRVKAKFESKELTSKSRLDDMIPYGKGLVMDYKGSQELIERDPHTNKFVYTNPAIKQRPKVFHNSTFQVMDFTQVIDFKLERQKSLNLAKDFGSTLSERYTDIPKKYRQWGNCGINVRAMIKSLLKIDIPDGGMYGNNWDEVLDKLTLAGWFEKVYVGEPENSPIGAILPYDNGFGKGARYNHGHVEVKLADNQYMHGERPYSKPGGSLQHVKSKRREAGFKGFAYIPKKVGEKEFDKYAEILAGVEVSTSRSNVVALNTSKKAAPSKAPVEAVSREASLDQKHTPAKTKVKATLSRISDPVLERSIREKLGSNPIGTLRHNIKSQIALSLTTRSTEDRAKINKKIRGLTVLLEEFTGETISASNNSTMKHAA